MVTTHVAPTPVHIERPFTSSGAMFAPEIQVFLNIPTKEELEARLSPQVLNALKAISQQMETKVFGPILHVKGIEQLKKEFRRVFARYASLYISLSFLLWGEIGDIASLASIWTPIATKFKAELENRGAETIGEEATNAMLVGLATMSRINRRLFELAQAGDEIGDSKELRGWVIAYWLATSCVFYYHFDKVGNWQNVRVLAYWSRYYAASVYKCAKSLGLIKVPVVQGPVAETSEEDRVLSEAGLDDLVAHLAALEDSR